jgi:hypothetical protein
MAGFYTIKQDGKTSLGATSQNGETGQDVIVPYGSITQNRFALHSAAGRRGSGYDATAWRNVTLQDRMA